MAVTSGADLLGFIHFAKSPRHLELSAMTRLMADIRSEGISIPLVAVVVDPDDALIDTLITAVCPDLIQLHGKETPERVADIRATGAGLIKAISVSEPQDVEQASAYEASVDYLLFDAKTPKDADLPGGLGVRFDWTLMQHYKGDVPWLLAGGLTPDTLPKAAAQSGAAMFDVSSGVESAPGVKDSALISRFLNVAKSL